MRRVAVLEQKDQLVLAAVERTHPTIVLDPDTEVFELAIGFPARRQHLIEMAPIHADVMQRRLATERGKVAAGSGQKSREFRRAHLTRRHRERAVVDCAETARMTVDRYIVGRIGEHRGGALVRHQHGEGLAIHSIAAQQPMATK